MAENILFIKNCKIGRIFFDKSVSFNRSTWKGEVKFGLIVKSER